MSGMNEYLSAAYGTQGQPAPTQEDSEKVAQAAMFAKLAAESGLNLAEMDDNQVKAAWDTFQAHLAGQGGAAPADPTKTAGEHGHKHGHKEKEAAAKTAAAAEAEFQAAKEWQQKTAEADFLGRQMAHAYVQELGNIMGDKEKTAGFKGLAFAAKANELKNKGKEHVSKGLHAAGEHLKAHRGKYEAGGGAAAAAAGAAAGHAAGGKKKKASALDHAAAEVALQKVAEGGLDIDEAVQKLSALLTLGVPEDTKIASAPDYNGGLEIRALELLEAAGYPVEWPKG